MKILLDYFLKLNAVTGTPQASTAFLKQVCVVVSPKDGGVTTGEITLCTSMAEVAALTNNGEVQELFDAGMTRVYVLPMDHLDLGTTDFATDTRFFTVLLGSEFNEDDMELVKATGTVTISSYANLVSGTDDVITVDGVAFTAQVGAAVAGAATFQAATSNDATAASLAAQINAHPTASANVEAIPTTNAVLIRAKSIGGDGNNIGLTYTDNDANVGAVLSGLASNKLTGGSGLTLGNFKGVVGIANNDDDFLEDQASEENRCAFHTTEETGAKNMFYAFGKLLSAANFKNKQYIPMPHADDVEDLGTAEDLFEKRISFVLSDDEYNDRLGLFACGGRAIAAPYIIRNLIIDMQSAGLNYVALNEPDYTITEASLIEDELQKVIDSYIKRKLLVSGKAIITLEQDNFVASADIEVPTPRALWRIIGEIKES